MSWWDKDWVRGIVHVGAAIATGGATVPLSAGYEAGRYYQKKKGESNYSDGVLSSAVNGTNKAKSNTEDGDGSDKVVYDGSLAEAEYEERKKKGTLKGQGSDTFSGGVLGGSSLGS